MKKRQQQWQKPWLWRLINGYGNQPAKKKMKTMKKAAMKTIKAK